MDEAMEAALMQAGHQINALAASERRLIDEIAALRKAAQRPLTDAQIVALVGPHADIVRDSRGRVTYEFDGYGLIAFARAVEAAKGE